jgi:hypothetical protein
MAMHEHGQRHWRSVATERRVEGAGENWMMVTEKQKYGCSKGLLLGRRKTRVVCVGYNVTPRFRDLERSVMTDFDGCVSYGDWTTIREYTGPTRPPP